MPVDFLSDEQARAYAQYGGDPAASELAQFFYLDANDQRLLVDRRGAHNRLGLALHLCTLRYLGVFLPDLRAVPLVVVRFVAQQLRILTDPVPLLERYQQSQMRFDHLALLKHRLGYREFTDPTATFGLARHLYLRAWTSADRPSVLFEAAITWLRGKQVVLPGVTTLTRFVARVRERVAQRLWHDLCQALSPEQRTRLEAVLTTPAIDQGPRLETLRRGETRISAPGLLRALDRLEAARSVGVGTVDLSRIPATRLKALATYAMTSKITHLAELADDRRLATLLAFVHTTMTTACDDALDILDALIDQLIRDALKTHRQERLRTLRDLDAAALTLADSDATLLAHANEWSGDAIKTYLADKRDLLTNAITRITAVARPSGDVLPYQELSARYRTVRRFLPRLLRVIEFSMTQPASALGEARDFLARSETQKPKSKLSSLKDALKDAPLAFVPPSWRRYVQPAGQPIDRQMYTLCFLTQLQDALHARDVFVPAGARWADPRAKLLHGEEWTRTRSNVSEVLQRSLTAAKEVTLWEQELDALYRRVGATLPTGVTISRVTDAHTGKTHERVTLVGLEAQAELPSLARLRTLVDHRLPVVDLSTILREIVARTGCASDFTHIGGREARLTDFPLSLCAVLLAEACNLPLAAVIQEQGAALDPHRLTHVQRNYVRPETITRANATLVQFHQQIPLSAVWGGGEVASADGLRFVVPVRTVNAGPSSKYFGMGRGVTLLNYTLNHFFGFNGAVITGTLRDSMFVLDGLLEQESPLLQPREIMTDTASYSDVVFGLFSLLGYRFSPRLADLGDLRFWRFDPAADYGALNGVSRHRLDKGLLETHWEDMLRVAGSLKLGRLRASEVMRMLQGDGRPTSLGRAIGEVGRIAKTNYLLSYLEDETYRRRIQIGLNRGESRHALARAVYHGQRGELRQAYREGQEEQLGVLGLVVNMIVIWNTLYQDRILADLRTRGVVVQREDIERLSPLGREHIKLHGHYPFALPEVIERGGYRSLRDWQEQEGGDSSGMA